MAAVGRPSKYSEEHNEIAYKLCLLGLTDKELADFFEVSESTINLWKEEHSGFSESIRKGKEIADSEVAAKLYHRAIGYEHPDVHISAYQGEITITELTKHYPPDTQAASLWLRNRQSRLWKEKQEITGADGKDLIPQTNPEESARNIAFLFAQAMRGKSNAEG